MPEKFKTLKIGLTLLGFCLLIGILPINLFDSWDFRNNLWGPARLLMTGRSPYFIKQLFPLTNAVWMPTIIGLLFPLGWLDFLPAARIWLGANLVGLGLLVYRFLQGKGQSQLKLFIALVVSFAFAPLILNLMLGQISILIALFLVLAIFSSESSLLAGFFLSLALAKPQLCVLVIPGLLFRIYRRNAFSGVVRLVGAAAIWAVLLCLPLFVAFPGWLPDFIAALKDNASWEQPSLFFFLANHLGGLPGLLAWAVIAISTMGLNLWIWKKYPPGVAAAWSLALTCLATPYIWSWDFVLLLPCFFHLLSKPLNRLAVGILASGTAAGIVLAWMQRWNVQVSDQIFFWLPLYFLGLFGLVALIQQGKMNKLSFIVFFS